MGFSLAAGVIIILLVFSFYQYRIINESSRQILNLRNQIQLLKSESNDCRENYERIGKELALLKNTSGEIQVLSEKNHLYINQLSTNLSRLEKRRLYAVKAGETLEDISRRFYGNPEKYHQIMQINDLQEPEFLKEGDLLVIEME